MQKKAELRRSARRLMIVLAGCSVLACKAEEPVRPLPEIPAVTPAPRYASLYAERTISPEMRAKIDEAKAKVAWIGGIHNEAMRDLTRNQKDWIRGNPKDPAIRCDATARLIAKYSAKIKARGGFTPELINQTIVNRVLNTIPSCQGVAAMSLFGTPGLLFAATTEEQDLLSDDIVPYLNAHIEGVDYSDGTIPAVASVGDNVLANAANASSLAAADFGFVAAMVVTGDSSATEWNTCPASECGIYVEDPYSIFMFSDPVPLTGREIRRIVAQDVYGCGSGLFGASVLGIVGATRTFFGAVASGAARISLPVAGALCAIGAVTASGATRIDIASEHAK